MSNSVMISQFDSLYKTAIKLATLKAKTGNGPWPDDNIGMKLTADGVTLYYIMSEEEIGEVPVTWAEIADAEATITTLEAALAKRHEERLRLQEAYKRQQYEALKKEFEGTTDNGPGVPQSL